MKIANFLSVLTLAAVAASMSLPASAQSYTHSHSTNYFVQSHSVQTRQKDSRRPTPVGMELAVVFPSGIRMNVDANKSYPVTLVLAQTIVDSEGNIFAPVESPVRAVIRTVDGGVQIAAESIVVAGRSIPVQAVSSVIPSHTVTQQTGAQQGAQHAQIGLTIADSAAGAFGADEDTSFRVSSAGKLLGFFLGSSSPKQVREVIIPGGSVHLMRVQWF